MTTLTRPQRAMQIAMRTSSTWTASVLGLRIPSQSKPGVWYTVSPDGRCDCPDAYWRGALCKHRVALKIALGRATHAAAFRIHNGRTS